MKFPVYFQIDIINKKSDYRNYFILKGFEWNILEKINVHLKEIWKISLKKIFSKEDFFKKIKDLFFVPQIKYFDEEQKYYWFVELDLLEAISKDEMKIILHWISRDLSDWFWEWFEQNYVYVEKLSDESRIEYYLHVRYSKNWELEIVETIENS